MNFYVTGISKSLLNKSEKDAGNNITKIKQNKMELNPQKNTQETVWNVFPPGLVTSPLWGAQVDLNKRFLGQN